MHTPSVSTNHSEQDLRSLVEFYALLLEFNQNDIKRGVYAE